ncbi:hypothetical protein AAE478_005061 [Parahypoxylon ruwenzoriense]
MISVTKILFVTLGVSAVHVAALFTGSCKAGETLIADNKCCPGYSTSGDKAGTYCCVIGSNPHGSCGNAICLDGSSRLAKVPVNDANFDKKVSNPLSGTTTPSQTSSSSSAAATPTSDSASESSDSDSGSSTSDSSDFSDSSDSSSTTTADDPATTDNAAVETKAMLGMVAAMVAAPIVLYL